MKNKAFPFFKQLDQMDCGPTCLKIIAKFHGKNISLPYLRKITNAAKEGVSLGSLTEASEHIGLIALPISINMQELSQDVEMPCIVHWRQRHYLVVYKIENDRVFVSDPGYGLTSFTKDEFIDGWISDGKKEGYVLHLEPTEEFFALEEDSNKKVLSFGLSFLWGYVKFYKKLLFQLVLGLLFGSLLQLVFPFLTQALVDYGIKYKKINFIYLILIGQLVLFISVSTVEIIRSWILLHMTARINISLISDFLQKLMKLPISFFESKNVGDIIQRIQDHSRIQSFLSITTLNTLFSLFNLIIFNIILASYNITVAFTNSNSNETFTFCKRLFIEIVAPVFSDSFLYSSPSIVPPVVIM